MSKIFDSSFLKKLENISIASKIVIADGSAGSRKSKNKGSSIEFSDYKEYTSGDDFRRIDWGAYGRFEKLYIKLFMEERESPVNVFLDTSKSMDWGEPNKNIASRRLAAALGYISLSNYDRVSIVCVNNKAVKIKSSLRGKNSLGAMLEFLEDINYSGHTDLYSSIRDFSPKITSGISIIISDFLSPISLEDIIKLLQYKKQEIYICHVLAPQEITPVVNTNMRLVDSETGEFRDVAASHTLIKAYNKIFNRYISNIQDICFKLGVNYSGMNSSMPVEHMVRVVTNPLAVHTARSLI